MKKTMLQSTVAIASSIVLGFVIGLYAAYNFATMKLDHNIDEIVDATIAESYDSGSMTQEAIADLKENAKENVKEVLYLRRLEQDGGGF